MPTTRKRRPRTSQGVPAVTDWKLIFLLDGLMEDGHGFEGLIFYWAEPHEHPGRWGTVTPWFALWEQVKDTPAVKQWRRQNPKKTPYAEQLLKKHK